MPKQTKKEGMAERFKRYPLDIFPSRIPNKTTRAVDVESIPALRGIGAAGGFDTKNNVAALPLTDNAYARTVRLHEACHGIYSPLMESATLAQQAVEDCFVHRNWTQATGRTRRDELCTAYHDLRSVQGMAKAAAKAGIKMPKEFPDQALLMALRAAAIIKGGDVPNTDRARTEFIKAIDSPVLEAVRTKAGGTDALISALGRVLRKVEAEDREGAVAELSSVMVNSKESGSKGGEKWVLRGSMGKGKDTKDTRPTIAEVRDMPQAKGKEPCSPRALSQNVKDLLGGVLVGSGVCDREVPVMRIRNLHQTVHKKTRHGSDVKLATSGVRVRAKKLAIAAASPVPVPVFEKKLHLKGGCVLIDASGSMHITDEDLKEIIEALPMGTIAYYSGWDTEEHGKTVAQGDLVIYCDKGQMYDCDRVQTDLCGYGMPFRSGGNSIDFQALQWLMDQPGPRWFIGDKGWCGCHIDYISGAETLLENAKSRGMVKHYHSLAALKASLGLA